MRVLVILILTFCSSAYSQETRTIFGKVIDGSSGEPIPFVSISLDRINSTTTDFDGKFKLQASSDSPSQVKVFAHHYYKKTKTLLPTRDEYLIELVRDTFDYELELKITGHPLDTIFFDNGDIKTIKYQYRQQITYYEKGRINSIETDQGTRHFFENGQIEYQSISYNPHLSFITKWYKNGQIKEHGSMYWDDNDNANGGEWYKSDNWIYWDKDGNKIKGK